MAASEFSSINMAALLNSQSVGHDLQEAPGYLAIVEQLDHVFSARFAHAPPQTAVLHQRQQVPGDVGHAGQVFRRPRVWKHDAMGIVDPVAFPKYGLTVLPLLRHFRQECRFTVDHGETAFLAEVAEERKI